MNEQTADNNAPRRGWIVDWALIIAALGLFFLIMNTIVVGISSTLERLVSLQSRLTAVEQNYGNLHQRVTDSNAELRLEINNVRVDLHEDLREGLRDLKNHHHAKHGGGK